MKKILLTCFLALPCLIGSSMELRKVAQSPPEPSIHRSAVPVSPHSGDTHRGGPFSRPDTFHKNKNGVEVSKLPLHNSGLSTVDSGPNYQTASSLLGAPRTCPDYFGSDVSGHLSDVSGPTPQYSLELSGDEALVSRHCEERHSTIGEWIDVAISSKEAVFPGTRLPRSVPPLAVTSSLAVTCSAAVGEQRRTVVGEQSRTVDPQQMGFSLVDDSTSQGQEEIPSARVGEGYLSDRPKAYIYGEVIMEPTSSLDTATLTTWPHFLGPKQSSPPTVKLKSPLTHGNLFEGSLGKRVFEFTLDLSDSVQAFSLALQTNLILDQYLIQAGDSIRVLINLRSGKILFGGPLGPKYQAQHSIRSALDVSNWDQPPAMITSPSGKKRMIEKYSEMYQLAEQRASSVRNSLRFIETKQDSLDWLKMLSEADFQSHPAWTFWESQKQVLGDPLQAVLASEIVGRQVLSFYRFMHSFSRLDAEAFHLVEKPEQFLVQVKKKSGWNHHSPEMLAALLSRSNVLAYHHKNGLFDQFDLLPAPIRDRLYGKFLVENVQKYTIEPKSFDRAIATVTTPWIQDLITEMKSNLVAGADFSRYTFQSPQGEDIPMDGFKGKVVLVNFWISGCKYCLDEFQNVIHPAEQFFKDDHRVVFLSVSADFDPDQWKSTLEKGSFTSDLSLPVYAGANHAALQNLRISAYPKKILVGAAGQLLSFQDIPTDPDQLIQVILETLETIPNPLNP